jgi:hypothetical protein
VTDDQSGGRERRGLAAAFALCALATLTLLAAHPASGTGSLADFLKAEARDQYIDGLVHGGFCITTGVLLVCVVLLSRGLGLARPPVLAGLLAFCIGSAALMASMILDGLVTPAIAVRLAGTQSADDLLAAKTLLILLGTLIHFLMPIGVLLQSAAVLGWSLVIVRSHGLQRAVGVFGLITAPVLTAALTAASATMASHVLLGGIVLQAIWYGLLATLLFRRGMV